MRRHLTTIACGTAAALLLCAPLVVCGRSRDRTPEADGTAAAQDHRRAAPTKRPAPAERTELDTGGGSTRVLAPPEGNVPRYQASRPLMGTVFQLVVSGVDEGRAMEPVEDALDEVERLEHVLSEWLPDSEISRVNAAAGDHAVHVGPDLMACVKASQDVSRWSDGAFDISWAALRGLWDFRPDRPHTPPSEAEVRRLLPLWSWRNIVVDEQASTLFLRQRGMQIGLGGIAKGYALDRAADVLLRAGLSDFMLYGGGQVLVHGHRGNRRWRVGIQHPREPRSYFAFLEMDDGSVATSGDYEHSFEYHGRRYHHILDPRTGFPSSSSVAVTVIARTGLAADAVDTAVFIMGASRGIPALAHAPGGPIEGIVLDPELHLYTTPGTERRLVMRSTLTPDGRLGDPIEPGSDVPPLAPHPPPPIPPTRPARRR